MWRPNAIASSKARGRISMELLCGLVLLGFLYVLSNGVGKSFNSVTGLRGSVRATPVARIVRNSEVEWTPVSHNPAIKRQILLPNGYIPHINGLRRAIFKPGQVASDHSHKDMHEIFSVLSGHGTFQLDGKIARVSAGTTIHIPPGVRHEVTNTDKEQDMELMYFGTFN